MTFNRRRPPYRRPSYSGYDPNDNVGQISVGLDGDLNIGIGGGLTIDTADGDLGVQAGGIAFDFGSDSGSSGSSDFGGAGGGSF